MKFGYRPMKMEMDWAWIESRIPIIKTEDTVGLIAYDEDADFETVGAVVFQSFSNSSAHFSLIIEKTMLIRNGFLKMAYDILFNKLGKDYCYTFVAENNIKSMRITKHGGFKEKMRIPNGFKKGVDYVVFELPKENCIYFEKMSEVA
jgi:hypothetical protein